MAIPPTHHVYYIDAILGHRYIADRTIVLDRFSFLVREHEEFIVFETHYGDGVTRELKGFKTKELALIALEQIKAREENLAQMSRLSLPKSDSVYQKERLL